MTGACNVEQTGLTDRITIREGDVWHLAETFDDVAADLIVTNPPFGVRMASSMDFFPFYRRVLGQMAAVLRPDGHVVTLMLREGPFNSALDESDDFMPPRARHRDRRALPVRLCVGAGIMVHSAAWMAVPEKAVLGQIYGKSSSDHKALIFSGYIPVGSAGEAKPVSDIPHQSCNR